MKSLAVIIAGVTLSIVAIAQGSQKVEGQGESNLELSVQTGNRAYLMDLKFFNNGKYLITASGDNKAVIWQFDNGRQVREFTEIYKSARSVAVSEDEKSLAIGDDLNITIWELATGKFIKSLPGIGKKVKDLQFMGNDYLFACGESEIITMYNVKTGEKEKNFTGEYDINHLAINPDKKLLFATTQYHGLTVWDIQTGKTVKKIDDVYGKISFSNEGKIAIGGFGSIVVLDPVKLKITRYNNSAAKVRSCTISPDGTKVAILQDEKLFLRTLDSDQQIYAKTYSDDYAVNDAIFSPDGKFLAIGGDWGEAFIIDVSTGKEVKQFKGFVKSTEGVLLDDSGLKVFFHGHHTIDIPSKILDLQTGKYVNTEPEPSSLFKKNNNFIYNIPNKTNKSFAKAWRSEDGKYFICAIRWTDVENGKSNNGKVMFMSTKPGDSTYHVFDAHYSETNQSNEIKHVACVGDLVVTGSDDHTAKVFDINQMKELGTLKAHSLLINGVNITPDQKRILLSSADGTKTIWDAKTLQLIATVIDIGKNDYVITTPDNYYMGSKGAHVGVSFRSGLKTFSFDQFDLLLNRPDIVLSRIGYSSPELISAYKKAYLKRLKKMNFTEEMLKRDFHLPEITIAETNLPIVTNAKQLAFNVQAKDTKYLLDRLNVYVNDVPVFSTKGIDLREEKVSEVQRLINMELSQGLNRISVTVMNDKGAESLKEAFDITYDGPAVKPDLYVLAIGISDYKNNDYDLKYASKDANDLATLLESKKESFNEIKIKRILDMDATNFNILQSRSFLESSKVDDQVIVFVAGHGLLDSNMDYYIATTDVDFYNPSKAGLKYDNLEELLDGIGARRKLMLIDACHSGEVDKEELEVLASAETNASVNSRGFKKLQNRQDNIGLKNSFELMQELFSDLRKGTGTVVISSASGVEFAFESSEWQNGVFTYSVLEGLKTNKADMNKNNTVTVSELRDYVVERVDKLTQGKQHPTSRKENLEFDFNIW